MSDEACYTMLGLDAGAPSDEIKRAYRNLSMKFHPDTSGNPATARRFSRMVKAYKILSSQPPVAPKAPEKGKLSVPDSPGDSPDLFALGSTLVSSRDRDSRLRAAKLLGLSGKRSAWVFLRKGILDDDEDVVCASIKAISALALAQGGGEIAGVYSKGSEAMRKNILHIAAATEAAVFLPALRLAMNDDSAQRRLYATKIADSIKATS